MVYLEGGLGNQLFQFAFCYDLNYKHNINVPIYNGKVTSDKQHGGISAFNILGGDSSVTLNHYNPYLLKKSKTMKLVRASLRFCKIKSFYNFFYDYDAQTTYSEVCMSKTQFYGYYQFVDSALVVKKDFEKLILKEHSNLKNKFIVHNDIAFHIRRGDFVKSHNTLHNTLSISKINDLLHDIDKNKSVVIFSDDIDWCIKNIKDYKNVSFYRGESAIDDFLALSQFNEYILTGSTFSWWAAFLFSNNDTKVSILSGHSGQFLSLESNEKINWKFKYV